MPHKIYPALRNCDGRRGEHGNGGNRRSSKGWRRHVRKLKSKRIKQS